MTDITNIINYYKNLLIIQYHEMPKAQATIELFVKQFLASGLAFDIREGFNLETAVGVQLDTLGKYIGVDRFYTHLDYSGYFSTVDYSGTHATGSIGFTAYSPVTGGRTLSYDAVYTPTLALNDNDYRFILKMKIIQNNSNHSHGAIDSEIYNFFGNDLIPYSAGNMEMTYFSTPSVWALVQVCIQKNLLPRPMGVGVGIIEYTAPLFATLSYDETDAPYSGLLTAGFTGYPPYDINGNTLNYNTIITE